MVLHGSRFCEAALHAASRPGHENWPLRPFSASPDLPVVPIRRSVLTCDVGQITGSFPRVSCPPEGRFAIVTKRGAGDAVDAKAPKDERRLCGRRSRGVLISRRWYQPADDAEASRRGWWQESPITRETTKETVKTIARGMPGDTGVTVVTLLTCFLYLHVRPRAQRAPGIPCALCLSEGLTVLQNPGVVASRECLIFFGVIARLDRAIQYSRDSRAQLQCLWNTGCPACAGHDRGWLFDI